MGELIPIGIAVVVTTLVFGGGWLLTVLRGRQPKTTTKE